MPRPRRRGARGCGADHEAVGGTRGRELECGAQRLGLTDGDLVEVVEHRPADLEQRREVELGLGLDAERGDDLHVMRVLDRVLEQRRFADARVAAKDERDAAAETRPLQRLVDACALALATDQHASNGNPARAPQRRGLGTP